MPRFNCVLFDADDTLFDFALAQKQSLENAANEVIGSFQPEWLEVYSNISSSYWRQFEAGTISVDELKRRRFEDLVDVLQLEIAPERLNNSYIAHLSKCAMLIEDCERVVKALSESGIKLGIVTNGLSMIQRPRLKSTPITGYFDSIIISDELGFAKPDARIFQAAIESVGESNKSKTLMVGDSLKSDIQGAMDFGIETCWFNPALKANPSGIKSKYEIQRLEQILEIAL